MSTDSDVLLTRREVERRTGLSRSTLYRKMREGTFPVPLKVSEQAVRWRERDIRAYVDSRPRSMGIRQHDQTKRPAV